MVNINWKYIISGILVLAVFSGTAITWEFNKDYITLKSNSTILVKERWSVEAERTWATIKYSYQEQSCIDKGGEIRHYKSSPTRCYYPEDYYEQLSRSLINTKIDKSENDTNLLINKLVPYYMYGSRGAYAGKISETFNFFKTPSSEIDFPTSYSVNWNPSDTRNYKLVWRLENVKGIDVPYGDYTDCRYQFGNIKIDLLDDCSRLERAEISKNQIYFYFKPLSGKQELDLVLVDPITEIVKEKKLIDCREIETNDVYYTYEPLEKEIPCPIENKTCKISYIETTYTPIKHTTKKLVCIKEGIVTYEDKEYSKDGKWYIVCGDEILESDCTGDGYCQYATCDNFRKDGSHSKEKSINVVSNKITTFDRVIK